MRFLAIVMDNARGWFDNVAVQVLPPAITFEHFENFSDGVAGLFTGPRNGSWQVSGGRYAGTAAAGSDRALSLMNLDLERGLGQNSLLELKGKFTTSDRAGFIFDYYGPSDFKCLRNLMIHEVSW